jgi:hypothetical protein
VSVLRTIVAVLAGLVALAVLVGSAVVASSFSTASAAPAPAVVAAPPFEPVDPGVRVDLSNEGEDVLGCLLGLGYRPVPGMSGRLPGSSGSLVVTRADRAWCGAHV